MTRNDVSEDVTKFRQREVLGLGRVDIATVGRGSIEQQHSHLAKGSMQATDILG